MGFRIARGTADEQRRVPSSEGRLMFGRRTGLGDGGGRGRVGGRSGLSGVGLRSQTRSSLLPCKKAGPSCG